jgi:CheY-like chemotaxis protein/GNAT superfamily N-acetyltransferase
VQAERIVHVVDPDPAISDALTQLLETRDITVRAFSDAESFLASPGPDDPGGVCLLVETDLPGMNGLALVEALRARDFTQPILLMATVVEFETRARAAEAGVAEVIEKPVLGTYLINRLHELLPGDERVVRGIDVAGGTVNFRMMWPEDADLEQEFVRGLSPESRRLRFFTAMPELPPRLLYELTHTDFPRSYAAIATIEDDGRERQVGVARYAPTDADGTAEFAVVVADEWQGHGIARRLLAVITAAAAIAGIRRLEGFVLRENTAMLKLARATGFKVVPGHGDPASIHIVKEMGGA